MTPNGIVEAVDVTADRLPGLGSGLDDDASDQLGLQGLEERSTTNHNSFLSLTSRSGCRASSTRPDTRLSNTGRIQTIAATRILLTYRSHSSSASAGVFQPSVFLGLALRVAATAAISSALCTLRSVPFGKY